MCEVMCDIKAAQASDRFLRAFGPLADRAGIGQLAGMLEVLGEFLILIEVGMRWQEKRVQVKIV